MLSPLWNNHVTLGGSPASTTVYMRIMEQLGFFSALGVVIVFIAAVAFGRIASVASGIRGGRDRTARRDRTGRRDRGPAAEVPAETVPVKAVRADDAQTIG